jgi:hypothetical protein
MAHRILRQNALELRKLGKSYSQIKSELGISKSTLSEWLRAFPLSRDQINQLRGNSEIRIEKYRQTMLHKREIKLKQYFNEEYKKIIPLSEREILIAGLFLYWGEGSKAQRYTVSINNTDPSVMKFALYWMINSLKIPLTKIRVNLHLYSDMSIEDAIKYWSHQLKIPESSFLKPYIKKSTRTSIDQKGFGRGTCGLCIHNTVLQEHILMAIKVISENFQ